MSSKRKPSAECLIAEYLSAYKAANNEQPNFRIVHVAGWVQFRSRHSSMVIGTKRLGYLPTMTKRLRDRIAAQGSEARSAETSGSAEGESPVTEGHAPDPKREGETQQKETAA